MIVPGSANSLLLRSAGVTAYQIERSIRLNAPDSAFLSRTPASAGNRKTWTYSFWLKRTNFGAVQSYLFSGPNASGDSYVFFNTTDTFAIGTFGSAAWTWLLESSAVFRDSSAWYHFVASIDTTQATASERAKIYVNGSQITAFSTSTYPSQNFEGQINNNAFQNKIGADAFIRYSSGYLADIHFIDGQALTPSSFAETNATTGQWVPKAYSGTYGTNGFRLAFADNSNNTATTLGKDTSGNGNNWTPNNLSVTAGAGNDSLVDTPTSYGTDTGAGGSVRGNYCTLNPLATNGGTLSNGNLEYIGPGAWRASPSTILLPSTGKWYAEATLKAAPATNTFGGMYAAFGVIAPSAVSGWVYNNGTAFFVADTGLYSNYSTGSSGSVGTFASGTVIGLAFNRDTNQITVYQDGVSKATVTLGISSGADLLLFNGSYDSSFGQLVLNFGQRPFAYTAPSGFKALCDTNLPAPVVAKPNTAFDVALWTGNGSARSITGLNFNPDFVWIKGRSGATDHALYDVVRGTEKRLESNNTDTEVTSDGGVTAFNSDGFSLGTLAQVNTNSSTYVGWAWDAGSSTVTNTQGSITGTVSVRANASAGFSVVTYTGNGSNSTVGHGLGVGPQLIIVKRRDTTGDWATWHTSIANTNYLLLNSTAASASGATYWNSTSPTSSVFSVGTATNTNANTGTYVAYCFAPVSAYSAFGSYTGNGSADGPFVFTGMRPRWVMTKASSSTSNWIVFDTTRLGYNGANDYLLPNSSFGEGNDVDIDILSNGFKPRDGSGPTNVSGVTYIYAAFAENPFQYARAR